MIMIVMMAVSDGGDRYDIIGRAFQQNFLKHRINYYNHYLTETAVAEDYAKYFSMQTENYS